MKNYKVLMTQPARDDLKDITTYIANKLSEPSIQKAYRQDQRSCYEPFGDAYTSFFGC